MEKKRLNWVYDLGVCEYYGAYSYRSDMSITTLSNLNVLVIYDGH